MSTKIEATIEDLYAVEGKAEIINGEIVYMSPTGYLPNRAAGNIYISLRAHEPHARGGQAVADNMAFEVNLPHRKSFSPDAAFDTRESTGMKFAKGAPVFAVEVRSENDYGATMEREMAEKRADYFACGTLVVWDVDLIGRDTIRAFHAGAPDNPFIFRRGEMANAEPAVPGWTMAVDDLFA